MNDYYHQHVDRSPWGLGLGKIVCVGRNYADHAKELNNPIPDEPLLFIKPGTAAVSMGDGFTVPSGMGECHHELEVAVLIGQPLKDAGVDQVLDGVAAVGLGVDLTLRDVQSKLKEKGQPWERAKGFDGACPLTHFVGAEGVPLDNLAFTLHLNGSLQQSGNTREMLFPIADLLVDISRVFTLLPGDVVLTGTPAGVGPLEKGDRLAVELEGLLAVETVVG